MDKKELNKVMIEMAKTLRILLNQVQSVIDKTA